MRGLALHPLQGLISMRHYYRSVLFGVLFAPLALLSPERASAQSVQLDAFRLSETPDDGFAVSRPNDRGHLRFGAQLALDYALDPLVVEESLGERDSESASIVEHQLVQHLALSLGLFDRLVVYAGLPMTLVMDGEDVVGFPAADGAGVGDLWFGVRARIFGEARDTFALGVQLTATAPTAEAADETQAWLGEDGWILHPELLFELRPDVVRIALNVGARSRLDDADHIENLDVGHELTYGVSVAVPIVRHRVRVSCEQPDDDVDHDVLSAHVEAYGSTGFDDFANRETSPLEAIVGLRVSPMRALVLGLAGGPGLSRGFGSPDLRGVFTIGYAQPAEPTVTCDEAPAGPLDSDHDGVPDVEDRCPRQPEDVDSFQDEDGCPDPDNDGDGVLDGSDGAPNDPEDRDDFEDTDGVPDPDNDDDGVLDATDGCPNEAEDRDTFADEDGCPDPDNDGDTVLDAADRCPFEPGAPAEGEQNGCPRSVRLDRETGTIVILQRVEFATNRDVILDRSMPILEEVAAVLRANPQLLRVRIEGHTDDRGRDQRNLDLSMRRARSVMRWLVEHQVVEDRLEAWGCGELHAIASNRTSEGRQENRRVEFRIVNPEFPGAPALREGCVEAER